MDLSFLKKNNFLVIGRAGMDLYAEPVGTRLEDAKSFTPALGGSSGNIAAGLAILGEKVSLLSCVSDDAVGRYTLNELKKYGIGKTHVKTIKGEQRTSLALAENKLNDYQAVIFRNGAADFEITKEQVNKVNFKSFGAVIVTGTAFAKNPSRDSCLLALRLAQKANVPTLIDLDYRAYSWTSLDQASQIYQKAAKYCDILIGNDDEFGVIAGGKSKGIRFAKNFAKKSNKIAIYKMGPKGSETFNNDQSFKTPILKVKAIKPVGAGDAFMAGFVSSLSDGFELKEAVSRGSANAAIVVTKKGCSTAMPTKRQLNSFLKKSK